MDIKLGTYEIKEEIGKGGMATVYRAYQANMDRDVAIKVIKNNIIDDSNALERFQQEARVIARLEHPHILPVYDFDGHNNPPYIVMRYLDGGTLKDVGKQGRLPLAEIAHIFQQIASALDYAHRQGIVHRDIKPSNIMVDGEGNVFVSDLGIARITGQMGNGRQGITASGAIVGTPEYMSPEQAMGRGDINHQADIYSLGVMLFEMLTGQLPYQSDSAMAILLQHIQNPIPFITEIDESLPPEIEEVIERAMAKETDLRYSSAGQFAQDLLQITGMPTNGLVELRKAAQASVTIREIRPIKLDSDESSGISTGSRETPGEQQRQITVMHVNLADFEEILLEINPEEASQHLNNLMELINPIIVNGGGSIREQTNTVIQGLWGVNEVREDDPEVAILTAIKIREIAKVFTRKWLEPGEESPVQIGIDTGAVLIRREEDESISSSGQAINYAVRIERAAPPGSVLITYDTFRHVLGVFDVRQETPVRVRGRSEPIEVYAILVARPRAFRLQTRGVEGIETKMVGRDSELKLLQDAFLLCVEDSETQMVTVTAEAGVGKSRLLYEFSRWIDVIDETVTFFEARATQQTTNLPYALIRNLLSFRFEILDSDTIPVMREKMITGIARFMGDDSEEASAFIGQLVGFDFDDHPAVQPVLSNAEVFQKRALEYLDNFFHSISFQSTLMELEDIHWADHQSLDLINELVSENRELPLMIICMARPELATRRPTWGEGQDYHHKLDLKPLSKLDSRRLLREVLQMVDNIPTELRDLIIERADGNPFYVEELVKILIEDGVIVKNEEGEDGHWTVIDERLKTVRVPPTLTGVLQARLDTLDPMARLLLGRASVIGRIFWASAVDFLQKADGFHIHKADDLLEDLREREMIFLREKSDFGGTQEYVIKHAILRDVIYESLLKRQQREYHKAAAEWLIEVSDERSDEYTGAIADHYELAGEPIEAAGYLLTAGKQANSVSALDEASILFDHALSILPDEDNARQMRVHVLREQVEMHSRRRDFEAVDKLAPEVLILAKEIDDNNSAAYLLACLGLGAMSFGDNEAGENYLIGNEGAESLVNKIDDKHILIYVLRQIGNFYGLKSATSSQAIGYSERSLTISREINDLTGEASAYNSLANAYGAMNSLDEAITAYKQCVTLARKIGDISMEYVAVGNLGFATVLNQDYASSIHYNEEAIRIGEKIGTKDTLNYRSTITYIALVQGALRHEVQADLHSHLQEAITTENMNSIHQEIETQIILYTREAKYERAAEIIGLNRTAPYYDPDFPLALTEVNKSLDIIREHLSETEIEEAIQRGEKLDAMTVAKEILAELEG